MSSLSADKIIIGKPMTEKNKELVDYNPKHGIAKDIRFAAENIISSWTPESSEEETAEERFIVPTAFADLAALIYTDPKIDACYKSAWLFQLHQAVYMFDFGLNGKYADDNIESYLNNDEELQFLFNYAIVSYYFLQDSYDNEQKIPASFQKSTNLIISVSRKIIDMIESDYKNLDDSYINLSKYLKLVISNTIKFSENS